MLNFAQGARLDYFPADADVEAYFHFMRPLYDYVEKCQPTSPVWRGSRLQQFPWDLWLYEEELHRDTPPLTLVEVGTGMGNTAEYLAALMPPGGKVITLDLHHGPKRGHPLTGDNVTFLGGCDSRSPATLDLVRRLAEPPVAVFLDTEHDRGHVFDELCLWAPLVSPGQLLLAQDTWQGVPQRCWRDYALGAVKDFMLTGGGGDFVIDLWPMRFLATQSPFGWLRRKA